MQRLPEVLMGVEVREPAVEQHPVRPRHDRRVNLVIVPAVEAEPVLQRGKEGQRQWRSEDDEQDEASSDAGGDRRVLGQPMISSPPWMPITLPVIQ